MCCIDKDGRWGRRDKVCVGGERKRDEREDGMGVMVRSVAK